MQFSDTTLVQHIPSSWRLKVSQPLLNMLRFFSLVLLLTALARPRLPETEIWQETDGVDILMALDASSSMLAEDFTLWGKNTSRFNAVKNVTQQFIQERENDRIGLVLFAGEAMTLCPLTTDYGVLQEYLEKLHMNIDSILQGNQNQDETLLKFGQTNISLPDGTAIGSALAFSTNRLKNSKAKSKVLILLTDGSNNSGSIDPILGAELAASQGIKVYTIGAGSNGPVPIPVNNRIFGRKYQYVEFPLDEKTLKAIADLTGGRYYRATHTGALSDIYKIINELETTQMEVSRHTEYQEIFTWFLIPGMLCLFLEILLAQTIFLRVP